MELTRIWAEYSPTAMAPTHSPSIQTLKKQVRSNPQPNTQLDIKTHFHPSKHTLCNNPLHKTHFNPPHQQAYPPKKEIRTGLDMCIQHGSKVEDEVLGMKKAMLRRCVGRRSCASHGEER
jgi:hypothetical protein